MSPVVGIDLGTTHSALAVASDQGVRVLPIEQRVGGAQLEARPLLPSALHAPVERDGTGPEVFEVGAWAEARARELPARSITSAKSWLSNAQVNREEPILPWGQHGGPRCSPVQASTRVLEQMVQSAQAELGPASRWDVTLTVPASFDDVARALTERAARAAGLQVRLVEEPIAAFGDFIESHGHTELDAVGTVLLVDVGGGTTDFSLLRQRGERSFERVASGSHLLLGGDNVDLALAHLVETRLGQELSPLRFSELLLAARAAKELLLQEHAPAEARVVLAAQGSKLLGSLAATLRREEVVELVCEGFLPHVDFDASLHKKSALRSFGLPYERDTAITRHLATFLRKHPEHSPDAVFFNGGFFRGHGLAERIRAQVAEWTSRELRLLDNPAPDLAVARGAAWFGWRQRRGEGRIFARSLKSYWLRVQAATDSPTADARVCMLPKGTADGVVHESPHALRVLRGQKARFELQADDQTPPGTGDAQASEWRSDLPILHVIAELPGHGEASVRAQAERTPLGLLELRLREADTSTIHRLEFDLKAADDATAVRRSVLPKAKESEALSKITEAFAKGDTARKVKDLNRDLERILGERAEWPGDLLRQLADVVLAQRGARRQSPDHERVFWNLLGFTLRPGRGAPGDQERIRETSKLFDNKLIFPDRTQNWQSFFIAWRRIASGLSSELQQAIAREFGASALPGRKPKKKQRLYELGREEMSELLASLEHAPHELRAALGDELAERSYVNLTPRLMTDLGRLGARTPFYAPVTCALPPQVVEGWLQALLRAPWEATSPYREGALAMARLTGDRARDLSQPVRAEVRKKLLAAGVSAEACAPLDEVHEPAVTATLAFYGDALPLGLRLE